MKWLRKNWRAFALVVAGAVAALTAEHTVAHKVAERVQAGLSEPAPSTPPPPAP